MTMPVPPSPDAENDPLVLQKLERFRDMKFGLMIHWGPYSVWGAVESWPICDAEPYGRDALPAWEQSGKDVEGFMEMYFALNQQFNPTQFEPEEWADVAADAGTKYLVFTTKHHDGFCMFDTRQTEYRATHPSCPFHQSANADVTKVLFEAFRRRGFEIGVYLSKADWYHCDYWDPDAPRLAREANYDSSEHPAAWARYVEFVHRQVEELMTGYGPVEILWLDSDWVRPPREDIDMPRLAAMARAHQPGLIVVDRAVGGALRELPDTGANGAREVPGWHMGKLRHDGRAMVLQSDRQVQVCPRSDPHADSYRRSGRELPAQRRPGSGWLSSRGGAGATRRDR